MHFAVQRAGQYILPKPGCMCTRLHRATSKKTITLTLGGRENLPDHSVTEYFCCKCREIHTHTHARTGFAVGSSKTSSISPPKHGHVSYSGVTGCQQNMRLPVRHARGKKSCVLISHLHRPFIYVSSPRLNTGNASHYLTRLMAKISRLIIIRTSHIC